MTCDVKESTNEDSKQRQYDESLIQQMIFGIGLMMVSDVDCVCVFLAQGFVFLGEESLTFQARAAHCAHEAGVVPGDAQSLQELVTCLDGKVAAVAVGPKQLVVVHFTVGLPVLHMEGVASDWLPTGHTHETVHMPGLLQSVHYFPKDLLVAVGAGRSKELLVTTFTVDLTFLFDEPTIRQGGTAVGTVELLRVPRHAHGHKERTPDDVVALVAHGGACPGWDVLSSLHQRVQIFWMWLWNRAVGAFR